MLNNKIWREIENYVQIIQNLLLTIKIYDLFYNINYIWNKNDKIKK
jgi:hypothetical protein